MILLKYRVGTKILGTLEEKIEYEKRIKDWEKIKKYVKIK